jgi:uncharacterized protein YjbI with pentapeptide repeats
LAQCQFPAIKYLDYESNEEVPFECPDEALPSGFCLFHDNRHYIDHPQDVVNRLMDKVTESIIFKKALKCIGYHLPDIIIKGDFTKPVYFSRAEFHGKAIFYGAAFNHKTNFSFANFNNEVMFFNAYFNNEANFSGTNFNKLADFSFATFKDEAMFYNAIFNNEANFRGASFNEVYFNGAIFNDKANFITAIFKDEVQFFSVKFNNEVYFRLVTLLAKANFSSTNFNKLADFSYAIFNNEAKFNSAKFQEADFINTKFYSPVSFRLARFQEAYFLGDGTVMTEFHGKADYSGARFQTVYFYNTNFLNEANFYHAAFQEANFFEMSFNGETNFQFVLFENGEKILFDVKDLSKTSFMNTDITRVRFGANVNWGEGESNRIKVVDEEKLEEILNNHTYDDKVVQGKFEKSNIRLGGIITIYRNLRENYEYWFRYEEADKFFISEMEVKRNYREKMVDGGKRYLIKKNALPRRVLSLTGLYHILLNYGQDYIRPGAIALGVVLVPILYSVGQALLSKEGLTPEMLSNDTETNLRSIFAIPREQGVPLYFIGIATVSIVGGLFIPALKRRFEKKFRR